MGSCLCTATVSLWRWSGCLGRYKGLGRVPGGAPPVSGTSSLFPNCGGCLGAQDQSPGCQVHAVWSPTGGIRLQVGDPLSSPPTCLTCRVCSTGCHRTPGDVPRPLHLGSIRIPGGRHSVRLDQPLPHTLPLLLGRGLPRVAPSHGKGGPTPLGQGLSLGTLSPSLPCLCLTGPAPPPGETGGVGAISSPTDQDRQGGQGVSPRDLQMEWSGETGTSQPWPHPHPHILPGPGRAGCPAGDELPLSSHSRHSALLPQDEASLLAPDRQRAKSSGPGPAGLVKNCFLPLKEYFKFF